MYRASEFHSTQPGRQVPGGDSNKAPDVVTDGATKLWQDGVFERWWDERSFERAETEVYSLDADTVIAS